MQSTSGPLRLRLMRYTTSLRDCYQLYTVMTHQNARAYCFHFWARSFFSVGSQLSSVDLSNRSRALAYRGSISSCTIVDKPLNTRQALIFITITLNRVRYDQALIRQYQAAANTHIFRFTKGGASIGHIFRVAGCVRYIVLVLIQHLTKLSNHHANKHKFQALCLQ